MGQRLYLAKLISVVAVVRGTRAFGGNHAWANGVLGRAHLVEKRALIRRDDAAQNIAATAATRVFCGLNLRLKTRNRIELRKLGFQLVARIGDGAKPRHVAVQVSNTSAMIFCATGLPSARTPRS